jgi:photosystem II stability/assembly factor-like uncharacterized protein
MRRHFFNGLIAAGFVILTSLPSQANSPVAGGSWIRQRSGSLAWLHSLFFLDHNRGWAAGSRGTLLYTEDGGSTWQAKPKPTLDTIRDIFFLDDLNGFLVCDRNIYELKSNNEPHAYLMRTTDGGEQWQRLVFRGASLDSRLTRAIFSHSGFGWAFGEAGAVYATRDAGDNWSRLQTPTRYLLLGGTFLDGNNGWLVGAGSTILQTTDGGVTWNHFRLPNTQVRFNSTSFVSAQLGWAVGTSGAIYRTKNGGSAWQSQNSRVSSDLLDVKFVDRNEGWVVGADGTLLHTIDGGNYWLEERSGTPNALERVFFTDRNHGWAVGFGGTIIAYGSPALPKLQR